MSELSKHTTGTKGSVVIVFVQSEAHCFIVVYCMVMAQAGLGCFVVSLSPLPSEQLLQSVWALAKSQDLDPSLWPTGPLGMCVCWDSALVLIIRRVFEMFIFIWYIKCLSLSLSLYVSLSLSLSLCLSLSLSQFNFNSIQFNSIQFKGFIGMGNMC